MALVVPDFGQEEIPVKVSTWLISVGETVCAGDRVVELSLPGCTYDLSAGMDGRLVRIEKFAGAKVQIQDCLGWFEPSADTDLSSGATP